MCEIMSLSVIFRLELMLAYVPNNVIIVLFTIECHYINCKRPGLSNHSKVVLKMKKLSTFLSSPLQRYVLLTLCT